MSNSHIDPKIELVFDRDCPHVPQAREVLRQALIHMHMDERWLEWELSDSSCPEYARGLGSPSILVNEKDVSPAAHNDSSCCRVYPENTQFAGCPSVASIVAAIKSV